MKRLICLALSLLLLISAAACSKPEDFSAAFGDVTEKMENLGINNEIKWKSDDFESLVARNPYNMLSDGENVYVSCGNYDSNKGPVHLNTYSYQSNEATRVAVLRTEQVNELYIFDGYIFALGVDPQKWGNGELYYSKIGSGKWNTISPAFKNNIHCYDMVKYKDSYFFCGSNVLDKTVNGKNVNFSRASVFRLQGEFTGSEGMNSFEEIFITDKNGNLLEYIDDDVPRMYQFFVFKDELYAYSYGYDAEKYSGIYKYNYDKNFFEYQTNLEVSFLNKLHSSNEQDRVKIQHDFEWNGKYYFVAAGLYSTTDFKTYKTEQIPNFRGYKVRDVIFKDGYALCLAGKEVADGTYTNCVFKTEDFESYTSVLSFNSELFARSMELCEGAFYFGLGFDVLSGKTNNSAYNIPKNIEKCGTVLRYKYK